MAGKLERDDVFTRQSGHPADDLSSGPPVINGEPKKASRAKPTSTASRTATDQVPSYAGPSKPTNVALPVDLLAEVDRVAFKLQYEQNRKVTKVQAFTEALELWIKTNS